MFSFEEVYLAVGRPYECRVHVARHTAEPGRHGLKLKRRNNDAVGLSHGAGPLEGEREVFGR